MKDILYAVIILNYNTIDDAILAAESVKKTAYTDNYIVCIADGGSTNAHDRNRCKEYKNDNIITVNFDKNDGYASGNNKAISFIKEQYNPKYYVIMNPDVLMLNKGTIDNMINRIDGSGNNIVGGQPLVWNCYYGNNAQRQINIRLVPNFMDICMLSCLPLKVLFHKRYKHFIYADKLPYHEEIKYRVPSGAFFIVEAAIFDQMGCFDQGTFLYYEEYIIGKKLENIGAELLFMPQYMVRHEHGKSTGNNHYSINKFARNCSIKSRNYYAKKYLHCNNLLIFLLDVVSLINIPCQYMRCMLSKWNILK